MHKVLLSTVFGSYILVNNVACILAKLLGTGSEQQSSMARMSQRWGLSSPACNRCIPA